MFLVFLITAGCEMNQAPQIVSTVLSPEIKVVDLNEEVVITVNAKDPNNDPMNYVWTSTGGILVSKDNTATFTAEKYGEYTITVKVSDNKGGTTSVQKTILVADKNNNPPVVKNLSSNLQEAEIGAEIEISASAQDPDNEDITFEWQTSDGLVLQSESDSAKAIFLPGKVGNNVVKVIVRDSRGGRTEQTLTIVGKPKPKVAYIDIRSGFQYSKDKLTKLESYLKSKGYEVNFVSKFETLSGEFLFIQNGREYTEAELEFVKDFVYRGGKLIISSMSDYQDKGNTESMNAILKELNAPVEFNDDQVEDSQNKVTGVYDIKVNWQGGDIKFYSSCSLILTDPKNAKIVVQSYGTAVSVDKDGKSDTKKVSAPIPLVVEFKYGLGVVKVLGTAGVYSDYDFDRSGFKNAEFVKNYLVGLEN